MKKSILCIIIIATLLFSLSPSVIAQTSKEIFVSVNTGSDSGDGSEKNPYQTLDKARQNANGGDTIVLLSGNYNSKVVFWENHYSSELPLTIKGASDDVNISAYDGISSDWSVYSGNIYKTNIGVRDDVKHALVMKNNSYQNVVEARWPNANPDDLLNMQRATMDEGSDHYNLVDSDLPDGNFNGCTAYIWTGKVYEQYVSYARTVKNYKAGQSLEFSSYVGDSSDTYTPQKDDWYYLTNCLAALDSAGEYYYSNSTGDFYIYMPDGEKPQKNEVQIQTREDAVELWASDYVNFQNLNLYGGVIVHDSNNCTFDNVNVYYSDFFRSNDGYNTHVNAYNSTRFCGNNNTFKNSEIAYTMSSGLLINGQGNSVVNCDIHDVAIGGGYNSAISIEGGALNTLVSHNNLYKSGRFLIYFINTGTYGDGYENTYIEYNDCYEAMYLTRDGGAIYGYHRNGKGVTIRGNYVHDCMKPSCGIYLDNECSNFVVRNNIVKNIAETGIVLNLSSTNNIIYRNTVINCGEGIQGWPKTQGYSQKGTIIANNAVENTAEFITGENAPTLITNKFNSSLDIDENYLPTKNSDLIDSGTKIDEIADDNVSGSVDIGALEYGGDVIIAGTFDKSIKGDVNFDNSVNLKDVLSLKKRLANITATINPLSADMNDDGNITVADVLLLKRLLASY